MRTTLAQFLRLLLEWIEPPDDRHIITQMRECYKLPVKETHL